MIEHIKQVALRIKSIREIAGPTGAQVAQQLGIPAPQLEAYENATTDIPLGILYALAGIYHVELTSLLTGEEPKMHEYALVRKGKGPQVERRKEYRYQDLAYNFKNKKSSIL